MDQTNNIRIRKSVSKVELKNRLYDKGISMQTMPSVKRTVPTENAKPYITKLNSVSSMGSRPPFITANKQSSMKTIDHDQGLGQNPSLPHIGLQQNQQQQMRILGAESLLKTQEKRFLKSPDRVAPLNDVYIDDDDDDDPPQATTSIRPQTSMEGITLQERGTRAIGRVVSNPQFTTLNMAPYSRPQTQAFGFRNATLKADPSRKATRASEEVTSITGIKTMTALGPSSVSRPKTSTQDLLKKRAHSNKNLRRRIIGGRSEVEEKRKEILEQMKELEEEKNQRSLNASPHRKENEKIVIGNQESSDEILRSHYLMAKIRGKADNQTIQRPMTTAGFYNYENENMKPQSPLGQIDHQRQQSAATSLKPPSLRPLSQTSKQYSLPGKSPFIGTGSQSKMFNDQVIDEQHEEDDPHEGQQSQESPKQNLDSTKSDKVVTDNIAKRGIKNINLEAAKWNDLDKLITLLQNQPDDDGYFIYLKPSEYGDPYDLQPLIEAEANSKSSMVGGVVSKKTNQIQKTEKFFTLSKKGITTYMNDEPVEYISLTDWLIERNFFQQISEKKFFKKFRRWKIIRMWRRNILQKKREEVKNNLTEKLFILDDIFSPILMHHRLLCKKMEEDLRIIDLSQSHDIFTLLEFQQKQTQQREAVVSSIARTSDNCRGEFKKGISDVLDELRQKINDQNEDEETHKKDFLRGSVGNEGAKEKKTLNSDPVFEQLGFKHNLKYGPRSKLRRACSRFLRFSYLLDFIALEALSGIYIDSVKDTISRLRHLASLDVDYELRPLKNAFGEQAKRPVVSAKDLPLFVINGVFDETDVPNDHLIHDRIEKYVPDHTGISATGVEFDPTVHLEIYDAQANEQEELEENIGDSELDDGKVDRIRVTNMHAIWLNVHPHQNDFASLLNECFQEGLECLKHFERWSRHEDLIPYVKVLESWDDKVCDEWDPPDDNNLNCEDWLQENYWYRNQSQYISDLLSVAFKKVLIFFQQLEPFLVQFWENKQLSNFGIIEDERLHNPLEVIPLLLERFNKQKADFENYIPETRDLGMIRVNFKDIKNHLTPSPKNCFNQLKDILRAVVRSRMDSLKQWMLQQVRAIGGYVTNVETYVKQVQSIEYIERNFQSIKDKIDLNNQIYMICVDYEIESKEEKNKKFVDEVLKTMSELDKQMGNVNESSGRDKEKTKNDILAMIPILNTEVNEFANKIKDDRFTNVNSNIYDILNEVEKLEVSCEQLVTQSKKIQEYQKTLDMDLMAFNNVEEVRADMMYKTRLWRALNEWIDLTERWQGAEFSSINVKEISTKSDQFTKTALQCERNLPAGCTAVAKLKKLVFDFKEAMPIVEALGNLNLKQEHWDEIKNILRIPEFPLEVKSFTLGNLIEFDAANYQEEIVNISITATQETNLRNELDQLKMIWDKEELQVGTHKEQYYKLVQLDVVQTTLDESLTSINNIIGSRYVKRVQVDASEMQEKLTRISDTLEQWKECQRNWIYLENIFLTNSSMKTQIAKEFMEFDQVNKWWNKLMKNVHSKPSVKLHCVNQEKNLKDFRNYNSQMDRIQKSLNQHLDKKRKEFPRFYFLSNDELLQILAAGTDIKSIEKHISKCFDNIVAFEMTEDNITSIISSEKEKFPVGKVKTKQAVEAWMNELYKGMIVSVQKQIKETNSMYITMDRREWVIHPKNYGQPTAVVAQINWTELCQQAIEEMSDYPLALQEFLDNQKLQLKQLTELIRGHLDSIKRKILVALITTDVHNRDIVETLAREAVQSVNDFNWQQQLRYSIDEQSQVTVRQVNTVILYGNEYMGATSRLVITPLTDRCWITITGAMNINLGAAPAGPAGTGKTESTKDLAKALGIYCVVFNCSEQIEYKMMARLFSGLAQSGAWSCLDEFNRIDVEVLSVIAQQLLDIKEAKAQKKTEFIFNAEEMTLNKSCGVFITMNPGYAGRTELPDNLKVLFRPVSMMIPNYGLIAEIMLFAEGFGDAKNLSTKMVQLYKLASEQLSQQDHYDFGMRAVKSVLVMAGALKRANPQLTEDVVLIRAMRDSNVPKFLAADLPLFQALIQDLFPGIEIPEANFGELAQQIEQSIDSLSLQREPSFVKKTIELFDTFNVRFGVMLVGPTGAGKTNCYRVLAHAMTKLRESKQSKDETFQEVTIKVLNPKSISMGELYGEEDETTKEWSDGLASKIIRKFARDDTERRKWCVFDGPVDALWIENMNTVLDDNMTLCLANGERIKLKAQLRMLFEVQDLAVASPATVSRCGMVYMTPGDLGWRPLLQSWLTTYIRANDLLSTDAITYLATQFEHNIDECLEKLEAIKGDEQMPTVPIQVVKCMCNFLEYFIKSKQSVPQEEKSDIWQRKLNCYFGFAFVWSFGSSFRHIQHSKLDSIFKELGAKKMLLPQQDYVFDYYFNEKEVKFQPWKNIVPQFQYDSKLPFFSLLVPTIDTTRYSTILDMLVQVNKPVFFTGNTGVGKSIIVTKFISTNQEKQGLAPILLNFSAQTNSLTTQITIENKLIKKKGKTELGAALNQTCVIFVDDVNMPMMETYGAQPPIELLRQLIDQGGFYDRKQYFFKSISKFIVLCAAAPPGGGRSPLTPRFMRHFHIVNIPDPNDDTQRVIFESILKEFLSVNRFSDQVRKQGSMAVKATIDLYQQINEKLLPIPAKFHYTFNLRDIAKVFQGILMTKTISVQGPDTFAKLWMHECSRVFNDRLINIEDRDSFKQWTIEQVKNKFSLPSKQQEEIEKESGSIIFSNILRLDAEEKLYEEIKDKAKLLKILEEKLVDYNLQQNKMELVFFDDAIRHISRICRILSQPRGNAMLIGVSGCGKQSLTRLASFMLDYSCFQIKLSKNYKPANFKEDLREQMLEAGCDNKPSTFLMTDTQIMNEIFLEDINNILNTGEITNLYANEHFDRMSQSLEKVLQQLKRPINKENIYQTYIERLRDNFHIMLCMSPVGDQLRIRCRKFPSLVNCCTLDWFDNWPEDALLNVSRRFISSLEHTSDPVKEKLAHMFMEVHRSVEDVSVQFYNELRRKVYITPKSYLDGINLYLQQMKDKRKELEQNISRQANGILKLEVTNEQIAGLKITLTQLQPKLDIENENANKQAIEIEQSTTVARQMESETEKETQILQEDATMIEKYTRESQADLAKAQPVLDAANKAVSELSKNDITDLKSMKAPAAAVKLVVECVLLYLGHSLHAKQDQNWQLAMKVMADTKFLSYLQNYEKEKIDQKILNKVKPIVTREDFNPEVIKNSSSAAAGLARWCVALREYAEALKVVLPKRKKVEEMQARQESSQREVAIKMNQLYEIKGKLQQLQDDYDKTKAYIKQLDVDKEQCETRLNNAGKLISLLGNEGERWKVTVQELRKEVEKLCGDVFIAAASISYIGPFTGMYREKLVERWINLCKANNIEVSEKYSLVNTLGDPVEVRAWNMCGLPSDQVSIDNGILSTKTQRWPLMIDPQTQANSWIKSLYKESGIKVVKLSQEEGSGPSYQKALEQAILIGQTVLIEDVSQELDPGLDPILTKAIYKDEGLEKIHYGDKPLIYDRNFRLFITTKLPNPHFLPEICIKLTVVNFTVTFDGLEEQLLADVVIQEAPEVEQKRDELVMKIANSKNLLKTLESKILKDLAESDQDTILDKEELITTLEVSKQKSKEVEVSLEEAEKVQEVISETRNSYRDVSIRGSILYFVIADLATIDPMYQNSLKYIKKLFNDAMKVTEPCKEMVERIIALQNSITKMLYTNICRGLFEEHKLIYSFLICSSIQRKANLINELGWGYLLRGSGKAKDDQPARPQSLQHLINQTQWDLAQALDTTIPETFKGLCNDLDKNFAQWEDYIINEEEHYLENMPSGYSTRLSPFEKLLLLKVTKPEKIMFACSRYVENELGRSYAESPIATMDALFADSDKKTPIIFVLSQGADPTDQVISFARKMDFYDRFHSMSLGQGQDVEAEKLIRTGKQEGKWILIQNCHLFKSWMPSLEAICEKFNEEEDKIHPDFRLIMTSMPANYFPATILQNGLKMTTEPPRGIKANLKRSYQNLINEDRYNECVNTKEDVPDHQEEWKRLLFGLCFFHAIVQERRKFGPLGWNIRYEFNDSDLETSITMLKNFLIDAEEIPWDAMKYMTGQINYGGRVTDDWDRVLLLKVLERFYTDEILEEDYRLSNSGIYYVPSHSHVAQLKDYMDTLPLTEEPEVFGMHQNANIAYQQQESEKTLGIILSVQPRIATSLGGKSSDEIVYETAETLKLNVPLALSKIDCAKDLFKKHKELMHCLSTVLEQEMERYNKLLRKMDTSLELLTKAIKGEVIMSPELDLMYMALLNNQVPPNWSAISYPSLKPLFSWIKDLNQRIEFMRNWLKMGHPSSYWLSGFFFPHGFMTGTLQTYARKHLQAIDLLQFKFTVLKETDPIQVKKAPEDGIIVFGLFIEGAKWSPEASCLEEQVPGEMSSSMPLIHFWPTEIKKAEGVVIANNSYDEQNDYRCPVYKTSVRAGILSTTGQSTNFILAVDLPCSENESPEHWTLRGAALLTMLND